ncbi:hypothetical protein SLA2020_458350 [Shorea laevis]
METSLRYGGDSKALKIHAKQKLPLPMVSNAFLQVHGELDTIIGEPSYLCVMMRCFYPDILASLGVGYHHDKRVKLPLSIRGKKAFEVINSDNSALSFNIKGRCHLDKEFKKRKPRGAAEFSWSILNFQKDQDVRLKLGYEVFDKVPYLQIRENNWTFNADMNGKWNVKFDL